MSYFPRMDEDIFHDDSFIVEHILLISSSNPWYGDILIYLQTLKLPQHILRDKWRCIRHQAKNYLIIYDMLYHWGVDDIFCHCLSHEEDEVVLNECQSGACDGHLFGFVKTQKILRAVIFGYQFLKIALKRSRIVTLSRCFLVICAHTLPLCTQSLTSVPSLSRGWISWTATQPQLGGIIILL